MSIAVSIIVLSLSLTVTALSASGDNRNAVKTIASIPDTFEGSVFATINDLDFDVVARNTLMLLVGLVDGIDPEEAVDTILHVWYSAMLRKDYLDKLELIKPLIEAVVAKIADKPAHSMQRKTWTFVKDTLDLSLPKERWSDFLTYFNCPRALTTESAIKIRRSVTLAAGRKNYRHRYLMKLKAADRVSTQKFWDDGLLLPFGHDVNAYTEPNPYVVISRGEHQLYRR